MAVVRVDSFPLVTKDDLVLIQFDDYETNARLFIRSLAPNAVIEVRSATTQTLAAAAAATTSAALLNGQTLIMDLPRTGAGSDKISQVKVLQGSASVDVVSPSSFHAFFSQPAPTIT